MDAKHSHGEVRCLISRSALLHNVSLIRKIIGPNVKICAVVKADAYGHDAEVVADTLCNFASGQIEPPMVDGLAVADIDEAAALPPSETPITVLRPVENAYLGMQRSRLEFAAQKGWILSLASAAAADDLNRICLSRGLRAPVQIMLNTGLNRGGADAGDFAELVEKIISLPALRLQGIATHFASSDEAQNPFNSLQLTRFQTALSRVPVTSQSIIPIRSAANSGGVFFHPESWLDMVRPGIAIYGIDPTGRPHLDRHLRPALRWTAPLIGIRAVPAGSTVGYGQTWIAPQPMRLGLVPVGYADGYPRSLSNCGNMIVGGQPARVTGRVSMDLTVIDLTQIPSACVGDEVTIIDADPLSPASVYKIADLAETIPYEILCRIGRRVRRVAVDDFDIPSRGGQMAGSANA
ncbi:MAG: alanine racemase [Tepidisphaeraceae bacterium]|jgi:alanine racemase